MENQKTNRLPQVVHAYKAYYPDEGGIPTVIKLIAEGLNQNFRQKVISTSKIRQKVCEKIHGVEIERLYSFGEILSLPITPQYPFAVWSAAAKADIFDYHFPMPWVDLSIATYFPKKTKLVVHWHSEIIRQKKAMKVLEPAILSMLKRADRIIVADKGCLTSQLIPYQDKCVYIPFGIDVDAWHKVNHDEQKQIQLVKEKYQRFILGVGRLVPYKGFSNLIQAMSEVSANLVIVGQGPLEHELKRQVKELNLADKVYFFGKAEDSELKFLYHAAEIFAFPSITENEAFGVVQLEAMACNKPIVNTSLNSGVPNVARHGQEALTVAPHDIAALSSSLNQLLNDKDLYDRLAKNAFARVSTHYSIQEFLRKTAEVYSSLLVCNTVENE